MAALTTLRRRIGAELEERSLAAAGVLMDGVSNAVRLVPVGARYGPADVITLPLVALWNGRRAVIEQNYALAFGLPVDHPRVRRLARTSLQNFGRMAIDFLTVRTMTPGAVLSWVKSVNERYLQEVLQAGRGALLVLPHAGSWDVAAAFAQAAGYELTVVTEDDWGTRLVAGSRHSHGVTLAPRARSLRPLLRALSRNECVVMLSDFAKADLQTATVPFFGRPARFPTGPARLSQHSGAPVLVVSCMRMADNSYRIEPLLPLYPDMGASAESAVMQLTAHIAADFERIVRAFPEQWYPFHPIWDFQ